MNPNSKTLVSYIKLTFSWVRTWLFYFLQRQFARYNELLSIIFITIILVITINSFNQLIIKK